MTEKSSTTAISVSHLKKMYGDVIAVEDVSFAVNEGEIFGLLGPNGAGNTTTAECITGLRCPDEGAISVLGLDPQVDPEALHPVIGVQLQSSTFPDKLKVSEILDLYQSFYPNPAYPRRAKELANMNNTSRNTRRTAFGKLLLNESRLAWRVPIGLGTGLGLPILLLVILGLIPGTREPSSDLGGLS